MGIQQGQYYCKTCGRYTLHQRESFSDGWGCFLTIITGGLFLILWVLIMLCDWSAPWRCQFCGAKNRNKQKPIEKLPKLPPTQVKHSSVSTRPTRDAVAVWGSNSVVCGVIGVLTFWTILLGFVFGGLALFFYMKQKKSGVRKLATPGLVLGIIALGLSFVMLLGMILSPESAEKELLNNENPGSQRQQPEDAWKRRREAREEALRKYTYTVLPRLPGDSRIWHHVLLPGAGNTCHMGRADVVEFLRTYTTGKSKVMLQIYSDRVAHRELMEDITADTRNTRRYLILAFFRRPSLPSCKWKTNNHNRVLWLQTEGKFSHLEGTRQSLD